MPSLCSQRTGAREDFAYESDQILRGVSGGTESVVENMCGYPRTAFTIFRDSGETCSGVPSRRIPRHRLPLEQIPRSRFRRDSARSLSSVGGDASGSTTSAPIRSNRPCAMSSRVRPQLWYQNSPLSHVRPRGKTPEAWRVHLFHEGRRAHLEPLGGVAHEVDPLVERSLRLRGISLIPSQPRLIDPARCNAGRTRK